MFKYLWNQILFNFLFPFYDSITLKYLGKLSSNAVEKTARWKFSQSLSSSHTFFRQSVRNPVTGNPTFVIKYKWTNAIFMCFIDFGGVAFVF